MMKDLANKIKKDVQYFDFTCPDCKSDNIRIIPLGISYTNYIVNNDDIENVKFKFGYKKIPHIEDVLKDKETQKACECNNCKKVNRITTQLASLELRKYLKKNKLEKPMVI